MKFIKRLPLDYKAPMSDRFAVLDNDRIVTNTKVAMEIPRGDNFTRPGIYVNGQLRYNEILGEIEAYNGVGPALGWEVVRTVRPAPITQKTYGPGDYGTFDFGPLRYSDGSLYTNYTSPQNILVFIENVFQIANTNYTLTQISGGVWIRFLGDAPPAGKYITVLIGYDGYFPPFPAP
jgi:hypothetical protein